MKIPEITRYDPEIVSSGLNVLATNSLPYMKRQNPKRIRKQENTISFAFKLDTFKNRLLKP
jgi:hypothetical protein